MVPTSELPTGPRRLPSSLRSLACLAMATWLWPATASAQLGALGGVVRDATTQAPIEGIEVQLLGTDGSWSSVTDPSGGYGVQLAPGTYYAYTRNSLGYTNEIHGDILCAGPCQSYVASARGTPIAVNAGYLTLVDFTLDRGGRVTGTVTASSVPATPLAGVTVTLVGVTTQGPFEAGTAVTDASGTYAIEGLPAGRYHAFTHNTLGYVDELYDGVPCLGWCPQIDFEATAMPIDVALGSTAAGRNFTLDVGGRITGTVTEAVSSAPVADACILVATLVTGALRFAGSDCVDASGAYDVGTLPAGVYFAAVEPFITNHIPEMYDNLPCVGLACILGLASATPIPVNVGQTAAGRDFILERGGAIRGVVRDALTSQPLPAAGISVFSRAGATVEWAGYAETDASGEYVAVGLPGGTYYAIAERDRYGDEIFDDIPCPAAQCTEADLLTLGTPVVVAGDGETSGIDFTLRNDIPPGAPQELRATVGGHNVSLSWSPSWSGGIPSGYVVEAGLAPGTTAVGLHATGTSYQATAVGPGRYYVRVRAVNAYGAGPPSEERVVVVDADGSAPPGPPEDVVGWISGQRLTLTWLAPTSGGAPTAYLVEAGSTTGATNLVTIGVGTQSLTYVPVPNGYYFVRIRAANASGVGPPSEEVLLNSGFVPSPPGAPRNLASSVAGTTVTLSWRAPVGGAPTSYLIRAGSAPGLSNLAQADTGSDADTAVIGGVPPGTYYVRIHAVNSLGEGIASNEVVVVVP